jgi:peroxiredoxin
MTRKQAEEPKKKRLSKEALAFVVVVVAVAGYLLYQGASKRPAPPGPSAQPAAPPNQALAAGNDLPVVPLISLEGERLELRAPGGSRPILLFIFSPTCSICTATLPTWKELHREAQAQAIEVVGLSVMEPATTARYVQENEVPWNVYCLAGRPAIRTLGIEKVPFTLVLEGTGEISLAMGGELTAEQRGSIAKALELGSQG